MSRVHPILSFTVRATVEVGPSFNEKLRTIVNHHSGIWLEDGPAANQFVVGGDDEAELDALRAEISQLGEVEFGELKVHYLETVSRSGKAEGKYIRQVGGYGNYAHCWLRVEPVERGSGYIFNSDITQSLIPDNYIEPIKRGVQAAMRFGIVAGFPMADVRVTLFDGSYHDTDSNAMAFQIAAATAFKEAARKAVPYVLEPMMEAESTVPEELVGIVIGDINSRRGRIISMERKDNLSSIQAILPLAEVLRSSTHGRPDYVLRFAGYESTSRGGFLGDDNPACVGKPKTPSPRRDSSSAKPETEF